ncbi:shikimate dehydrogenase family protein [Gryllotalpicola reticulitermitis]|uniref:Shikimate dehydrogenase family protein n=1 Tax=Gryllotalpicola reticulitermitis TaxID=1184153 RepID=A0ABV8Q1V7_9MICO
MYPIIGDPIKYVETPARLTRTFEGRGHDGICVPLQVPEHALSTTMAALTAVGNVDGILVTMPHKRAAIEYCDTVSSRAETLGVVSVMRRRPHGGWHGDMLDGVSFVAAQQRNGARIEGARALLLGAGGAGSAIAMALLGAGVSRLVIHDADESRAEALLSVLSDDRATVGTPDPSGCDLVLNATPMGMNADDPIPVVPTLLTPAQFVGDVIAGHGVTRLISAAQDAGCATASGGDMVEAGLDLMADFFLSPGLG